MTLSLGSQSDWRKSAQTVYCQRVVSADGLEEIGAAHSYSPVINLCALMR
jgi:hypothetical protein